jgi:hypothetical protein
VPKYRRSRSSNRFLAASTRPTGLVQLWPLPTNWRTTIQSPGCPSVRMPTILNRYQALVSVMLVGPARG